MTVERPKALLPLVNVPMIAYTLEWLVAAGIEEVRPPALCETQQERCSSCTHWGGYIGIRTDWLCAPSNRPEESAVFRRSEALRPACRQEFCAESNWSARCC